uniref:transcription cofactor vestigial-like protein 4 n=1 Tax=Pristiophorus japonicus TaxID=55135 RepID=UPI00398EF7AF
MAVMNYQYIKEMNGFRVYILEGHPSLKSDERRQLGSNHRTGPPPNCPIKRKHPAEPSGVSQSVEERHSKAGGSLAVVDTPMGGEGPGLLERGKGPSPAGLPWRAHGYEPPGQALSPPSDQPLALIKRRPSSSRQALDSHGPLPPNMLQQVVCCEEMVKPLHKGFPIITIGKRKISLFRVKMRPSVITCAPSTYRQRGHSQSPATHGHSGGGLLTYSPDTEACEQIEACDSVVEEHFRRSLGKDYRAPEPAATSVSTTGSVDDHFAKALGAKWLQIRTSGGPGAEMPDLRAEGAPSPDVTAS